MTIDAPLRARRRDDDAVRSFLRSFGLSAAAARRAAAASEALRDRTARTGIEFAATFDAATGAPLGAVLAGGGRDVDIGQHLQVMVPGRRYVTVHTHPANTPPSDDDAVVLVLNPQIQVVAVIGAKGKWYALSAAPGVPLASEATVRLTFAAAFLVLRSRHLAVGRAQRQTDEEIMGSLLDAIWRTIALTLGLRYDRMERTLDGNHQEAVAGPRGGG